MYAVPVWLTFALPLSFPLSPSLSSLPLPLSPSPSLLLLLPCPSTTYQADTTHHKYRRRIPNVSHTRQYCMRAPTLSKKQRKKPTYKLYVRDKNRAKELSMCVCITMSHVGLNTTFIRIRNKKKKKGKTGHRHRHTICPKKPDKVSSFPQVSLFACLCQTPFIPLNPQKIKFTPNPPILPENPPFSFHEKKKSHEKKRKVR